MRLIVLATMFGLLSPVAYGQTSEPPPPPPPPPAGMAVPAPQPPPSEMNGQQNAAPIGMPPRTAPDPTNCGTPYEPKTCPPMPRHPLKHYPANR